MNNKQIDKTLRAMISDDRLAEVAQFFGHDRLRYDSIDVQSRDFDFSEGHGETWEVAHHKTAEEVVDETLSVELECGSTLALDWSGNSVSMDIEATELLALRLGLREAGDEYEEDETWSDSIDASHKLWKELLAHFEIDPAVVEEDDEDADWDPMMNTLYPLGGGSVADDWHRAMHNMTVVYLNEEDAYYLALTGGGMDMTWSIVETYLRLGYYPPAEFASRLPGVSGRGESERDKAIIDACRETLRVRAQWALSALERLTEDGHTY